jgi:hypothetical protein
MSMLPHATSWSSGTIEKVLIRKCPGEGKFTVDMGK